MKHQHGPGSPSRRRVITFRVLATLTALLFLGAGLDNALAGWMVISGASGDLHPEANRWFITTAGVADVTVAGSLLALALRPRLSLLFFYCVVAFAVAAAINLPFVPEFVVILALTVPALVCYPYWAELRTATMWCRSPRIVPLAVGVLASAVVFTIAVIAIGRQIGGTDAAAQANWWADYAEHVSLLGIAALVASSGRPGWRILAVLAGLAWMYLGFVAVFLLPTHAASWGTSGGLAGLLVGITLTATAAAGERPRRVLALARRSGHV
jgi:hypothetical protein